MKKILLVFLATALVFGCQKKEKNVTPNQQDVVFGITQVDPGAGLKSTENWICPTDGNGDLLVPVTAEIKIVGYPTVFTPEVYSLDGKLYTQAIKLPVGNSGQTTYTVTRFLLKDANGTTIMATPTTGSDYSEYVSQGVSFTFEVNAFAKAEVPVEVLCFLPEEYTNFGFDWFIVTQTVVREKCFFGDICLNGAPYSPADYTNSFYDLLQAPSGTQSDMPAIIKMHVFKNGTEVPNSPFTNATADANYGVGSPLCVQYPDNLDSTGEVFTFELWILVKNAGGSFSYQLYHTFTATDDGDLDVSGGTDGVVDFVLGTCNSSTTDLQLNWLPPIAAVTVYPDDLATENSDLASDLSLWFYYDDGVDGSGNDRGIFAPDNANNFFTGPDSPPAGTGSAQIYVPAGSFGPPNTSQNPQYALATRQFVGIPLADITTMKYSVYYDPNNSLPTPVINFNVSFDGNDTWQGRLTYTPPTNTLTTATWVEYDALTEGTWRWSGKNTWPSPNPWTGGKSWANVKGYYPNAKMRISDSWFGMRVDDNSVANTQHVDKFIFGVNSTSITYDFEPQP